jgi:hypothetical protein
MEGPRRLDRRKFLKGMLQTAAVAAVSAPILEEARLSAPDFQIWQRERSERMRFDRFSGLAPAERERIITKEVEEVGAFIRGPEGKRILESGTDDEIGALMTILPPLLHDHIKGTRYDIDKDHWPSTVVNVSHWKRFTPQIEPDHSSRETLNKHLGDDKYGNGFLVDEQTLVTNQHVVGAAIPSLKEFLQKTEPGNEINHRAQTQLDSIAHRTDETGIDVATLQIPTDSPFLQHTHNKLTSLHNDDIHGRLVITTGIKPDDSSERDGTKVYVAMAIRVTPHLTDFLARHNIDPAPTGRPIPPHLKNKVIDPSSRSFIHLLPPGESTRHRTPSETGSRLLDQIIGKPAPEFKKDVHASGMSGSPVLMGNEVVGINHRITNIAFKNTCFDIAYFHGPDELRESINDPQRCMPTEWPTQ